MKSILRVAALGLMLLAQPALAANFDDTLKGIFHGGGPVVVVDDGHVSSGPSTHSLAAPGGDAEIVTLFAASTPGHSAPSQSPGSGTWETPSVMVETPHSFPESHCPHVFYPAGKPVQKAC